MLFPVAGCRKVSSKAQRARVDPLEAGLSVAVEGEADVCHLDADLVMAAGEKMNPDEGERKGGESRIFQCFQAFVGEPGLLRAFGSFGNLFGSVGAAVL